MRGARGCQRLSHRVTSWSLRDGRPQACGAWRCYSNVQPLGGGGSASSSPLPRPRDAPGKSTTGKAKEAPGRPQVHTLPGGSKEVGIDKAVEVHIEESRLEEFLRAEVAYFSEKETRPVSIQEVLDASDPQMVAALVLSELPIRFAKRIRQIETLPLYKSSQQLLEIHALYEQSFRELRLVGLADEARNPDEPLDAETLHKVTEVVNKLKKRMVGVIPRLATAMRNLDKTHSFPDGMVDRWLDKFLLSRIGTEMLSSQYLACWNAAQQLMNNPRAPGNLPKGIVDNKCDPAKICEHAARHARKLCKQHYHLEADVCIVVESEGCRHTGSKKIRFPYVPQYLFYVMVELLKNSCRATVESCKDIDELSRRPIVVTVGADRRQVAIRVLDAGGGIPFAARDRVWSYMYSTAHARTAAEKENKFVQEGTPLAGYGVGLPLSRLYARYLGGSLHLMSMPTVGTAAYLYLNRLAPEAREEII